MDQSITGIKQNVHYYKQHKTWVTLTTITEGEIGYVECFHSILKEGKWLQFGRMIMVSFFSSLKELLNLPLALVALFSIRTEMFLL